MPDSVLANALIRILAHVVSNLMFALMMGGLFIWDFALTLYNQFAPLKPANGVVPEGCAGAGGLWPQYVPPTSTDSRSSCPALNAMANHGKQYFISPARLGPRVYRELMSWCTRNSPALRKEHLIPSAEHGDSHYVQLLADILLFRPELRRGNAQQELLDGYA